MGNTVNAASKTVSDAGCAVGNGVTGGILYGCAAMKSSNDPVRPIILTQAQQRLDAAKQQTSAALIGELQLTANIKADISRPFDIDAKVRTQCAATRGIGGLVASPILYLYQSNMTQFANEFIENELKKIFDDLRGRVKQIQFVKDQNMNRMIQELWEPQSIKGAFTQNDSLLLTMDKDAACTLISKMSRHLTDILNQQSVARLIEMVEGANINPNLTKQLVDEIKRGNVNWDFLKRTMAQIQSESATTHDVSNLIEKIQATGIVLPAQRFSTKTYYETKSEQDLRVRIPFLVQIVVDFEEAQVRVELFGMETLLHLINSDMRRALQSGIQEIGSDVTKERIGKPLEVSRCKTRTQISPQYLQIGVDVSLRMSL